MKKILIVADHPYTNSGFGKVMRNVLKKADLSKFNVTYLAKNVRCEPKHNFRDKITNVRLIYNQNYDHMALFTLRDHLLTNDYDLIFIYDDIDILFMHYFGSSLYGFKGNEKLHESRVVAYTPVDTIKISEKFSLLRNVIKLKFLAFCEFASNVLESFGLTVVGTMGHAADDMEYLKLDEKQYDLLYVGRLDPRKNAQLLLDVLNKVASTYEGIRIALKVSNDILTYRLLSNYKLRQNIHVITDFMTEEDMKFLYNKSRFFVSLSHAEGWGLGFTEAQMCRVPVIATDFPVHKEVIGPDGIYVNSIGMKRYNFREWPIIHANDAYDTILKALQMNEKDYVDIAYKQYNYAKRYTWDNAAKMFEKILEEE